MRLSSFVVAGVMSGLALSAHAQCVPDLLPFTEPQSVLSMTVFNGDLVIGGATSVAPPTARWTGSAWQGIGPGVVGGRVNVTSLTVFQGDLIRLINARGVERWTGSTWVSMGSAFTPVTPSLHAAIVYRDELIIAGKFTAVGGRPINSIARWDGSDWQPLGQGFDTEVVALAVYNDELIAGGRFTQAGGQPIANIARWDGAMWRPVGAGLDGWVFSLTTHHGELIAGGQFQHSQGASVPLIARFDGVSWTSLNGGLSHPIVVAGIVTSLATYRDQLIVGGQFTSAGSVTVKNLARWTGDEWIAMPGITSMVNCLAVWEGDVYAGGQLSGKLRRYGCPPCIGDLDADGQVDHCDMLEFGNLYGDADPRADLNEDGLIDSADWAIFFDAYAVGCP